MRKADEFDCLVGQIGYQIRGKLDALEEAYRDGDGPGVLDICRSYAAIRSLAEQILLAALLCEEIEAASEFPPESQTHSG